MIGPSLRGARGAMMVTGKITQHEATMGSHGGHLRMIYVFNFGGI